MSSPGIDRTIPLKVFVEVTDTVSIGYTTGIQRVVRELISGLGGPTSIGLELVPILKPSSHDAYRLLTLGESEHLRIHPPGGTAGRRADKFGPLSPLVRVVGDQKPVISARVAIAERIKSRREGRLNNAGLNVEPMDPGSVFLDIEGSWFDPEPRSELLPRLVAGGVQPMVLVHDVMPLIHPEWFADRQIEVFREWIDAHLTHTKAFLANSECTARDLRKYAQERGFRRELDATVIPLGADYSNSNSVPVDLPGVVGRYLLVVGTLEPRKNQKVVLDAFDRLSGDHPDLGLVLVGKEGWMVESLVARIRRHPLFGERLLWFGGIDDDELTWLYQNAFVSITPSRYEGLGVPVIEALSHGCPTISSNRGALPEAAPGYVESIDPDDVDGLTAILKLHLDTPEHHQKQRAKAQSYEPTSWTETTRVVADAIVEMIRTETSQA